MVCSGIRLLLLIYSFLFLSLQFSNIRIFVTSFSGTVRPRRLKLDTHMDSGQMYRIYRNKAAAAYLSLYSVFFLSNSQTLKIFITLFSETVRPRRLRLGAHVDKGGNYHVYRNQAATAYLSLYFFIFLSLQFSDIKMFCHTFLGNCEAKNISIWYTCRQWVDVSCISEWGCCCLFFPLFLYFSLSPIIKH